MAYDIEAFSRQGEVPRRYGRVVERRLLSIRLARVMIGVVYPGLLEAEGDREAVEGRDIPYHTEVIEWVRRGIVPEVGVECDLR